jgi:hypothetical protein
VFGFKFGITSMKRYLVSFSKNAEQTPMVAESSEFSPYKWHKTGAI